MARLNINADLTGIVDQIRNDLDETVAVQSAAIVSVQGEQVRQADELTEQGAVTAVAIANLQNEQLQLDAQQLDIAANHGDAIINLQAGQIDHENRLNTLEGAV